MNYYLKKTFTYIKAIRIDLNRNISIYLVISFNINYVVTINFCNFLMYALEYDLYEYGHLRFYLRIK